MDFSSSQFWVSLLQIIWIDLLLSGDNAVVIALACRQLPPKQRTVGIWLGASAAIGLRIIFALVVTYLLLVPYLKIVGGLLLFWIAVKLAIGEDESHAEIDGGTSLWQAVRTIAIADAVMSLDNVIAIAAASRGHPELFIFGLLLSIPLIIMGAQFLTTIIQRFPILIWLGAGLLGWIAAEMILGDIAVLRWLEVSLPTWIKTVPTDVSAIGIGLASTPHYVSSIIGAALVCVVGYVLKKRSADQPG